MKKYLYFLFFGIILYYTINAKDKFLVDFIPSQMNKCKLQQCTNQGDCELQCYATLFYDNPVYYERTQTRYAVDDGDEDKMRRIVDNINRISGQTTDQAFPDSPDSHRYLNGLSDDQYSNKSETTLTIFENIFTRIPINKARLVYFIKKKKGQEYHQRVYHYIIFANYENDLYILDPKHRVIFKNSDIFHNPWFEVELGRKFVDVDVEESFDWSLRNYGDDLIFFYAIISTDQSDNNVEHTSRAVRNLLVNGNKNLTREMSLVYIDWYRKNESGQLLYPTETTYRVCAASSENSCNIM
tara:strand:- start:357 stop:1250 length:894 start_codon:yes stop_codon:yes gene_type:complete